MSGWDKPCALTADGEEAWCSAHLAELVGRPRAALAAWLSQQGGFAEEASRSCDTRRTRGRVVPRGVVLALDLDVCE